MQYGGITAHVIMVRPSLLSLSRTPPSSTSASQWSEPVEANGQQRLGEASTSQDSLRMARRRSERIDLETTNMGARMHGF